MYGSFSRHVSSSVKRAYVWAHVRGSLCRWWAWLCPCVSLCQRPRKGRPEGLVLHFYSFINSPLRSDCGCQIGLNERRDKEGLGGTGRQLNACFHYIVNKNVCKWYLWLFCHLPENHVVFFVFLFTTAWWWSTCPVKDLNIQPTDLARSLKVYSWDFYLHRVEISRTGPIFQLTVIIYDSPRVKDFSFARPTARTELSCIRMAGMNWWDNIPAGNLRTTERIESCNVDGHHRGCLVWKMSANEPSAIKFDRVQNNWTQRGVFSCIFSPVYPGGES